MAFGRQTDDKLVKPLGGAIIRRRTVGATTEAGEAVYLDSNGKVQPTNAGAVATNYLYGIAVQDGAVGDVIDIVVQGPCDFVIEATPGGIIYTTDTAGEPGTTNGTKKTIIGVAESATTVFIRPQIIDLA